MADDLTSVARYPNFTQAAEHKLEDTRVTLQRASEISRAITQAEDAAAAAVQGATQVRAATSEGQTDMAMSEIQRLQALLQSRQESAVHGYASRPQSRPIDASAPSSDAVVTDPAANGANSGSRPQSRPVDASAPSSDAVAPNSGTRPQSRPIEASAPNSGSRPQSRPIDASAPSSDAVVMEPAANGDSFDIRHDASVYDDSGTMKQVGPLLAQSIESTAILAQQMLQTAQFMESGSQIQSGTPWLKAVPLVAGSQREEALQKLLPREEND